MAKRKRRDKSKSPEPEKRLKLDEDGYAVDVEETGEGIALEAEGTAGSSRKDAVLSNKPVDLKSLRLKQGTAGMQSTSACASGLGNIAERDRILTMLLPAEVESSVVPLSMFKFRQLDGVTKWHAAVAPPKSLLPKSFNSTLALPEVRKVLCTVNHTNFGKMADYANKSSLIFHKPNVDMSIAKNIGKNSQASTDTRREAHLRTPSEL